MSNERDPRIDPRPGDTYSAVGYPDRTIVHVSDGGKDGVAVVYSIIKVTNLETFRRWAKNAHVAWRGGD